MRQVDDGVVRAQDTPGDPNGSVCIDGAFPDGINSQKVGSAAGWDDSTPRWQERCCSAPHAPEQDEQATDSFVLPVGSKQMATASVRKRSSVMAKRYEAPPGDQAVGGVGRAGQWPLERRLWMRTRSSPPRACTICDLVMYVQTSARTAFAPWSSSRESQTASTSRTTQNADTVDPSVRRHAILVDHTTDNCRSSSTPPPSRSRKSPEARPQPLPRSSFGVYT